ncbi:MAG: flagellar protein FliS [Candidatus Endobugula sp.]|jgi:flagellar protein FliS
MIMSTSLTLDPIITQTPVNPDTVTPYQVITLLLDGALERIDQAINRVSEGDIDAASVLVQKAIGIVGGLRDSLNLQDGGEIAGNLDALYEYIVKRLGSIDGNDPLMTLEEVKDLLQDVYAGWDGIATHIVE